MRMVAATAFRLTAISADVRWPQDRRRPWRSHSQTVMDNVLVLLRDGLPLSEITTVRK